MRSSSNKLYDKNQVQTWPVPNYWDVIVLVLVMAIICLLGWGAHSMTGRWEVGQVTHISLDPRKLPYYALLTVVRMFVAMFFSLLFTFTFATWAARSPRAERVIIPAIDILQSVPVLGFLSITVVAFIVLFRGSMLGPECAAIFAIFTAQAWNIALSFYQSLKMLPGEMREAARIFHLSAWQKFWRMEVPFAMPGLVWNMMLSMSGSWIFLVASEAITVADHEIYLPGVGSYIAMAILHKDTMAILYVILTMIIVIGLIDQIIFRPLVAWSEKFKASDVGSEVEPESWFLNLFQRTKAMRFVGGYFSIVGGNIVNFAWFRRAKKQRVKPNPTLHRFVDVVWNIILGIVVVLALVFLFRYILQEVSMREIGVVITDGLATTVRVIASIVISTIIWVPIGVWIGLNPRASQVVQPITQFLAAFPMNLVFPLVVWAILLFHLSVNVWVTPLMILGSQWYILFNVIAGTMALPKNLHYAVGTLNVTGWLWWRRFILPGIFPYYITGAITAAGAAWNVSIIAEAVSWGHTQLWAKGLGAYIVRVSDKGDFHRLALGIVIMSLFVLAFNRFIWRPLYNLAEERFQLR